jgi:hypothetical protein
MVMMLFQFVDRAKITVVTGNYSAAFIIKPPAEVNGGAHFDCSDFMKLLSSQDLIYAFAVILSLLLHLQLMRSDPSFWR